MSMYMTLTYRSVFDRCVKCTFYGLIFCQTGILFSFSCEVARGSRYTGFDY